MPAAVVRGFSRARLEQTTPRLLQPSNPKCYRGLLLPVVVPLPDVVPEVVPVVVPVTPVDEPEPPGFGRVDGVTVDGDDVLDGDRIDSHGSFDADVDCDAPRAELGPVLAVVPVADDAVVPAVDDVVLPVRERGWSPSAPVPARGPVSVAVLTGSFEELVVPVELLARLVGDAASFAFVADVPVVPTAEGEPRCAVVARFVEPAVPAPTGPHGSVVLPMLLDAVVPVPCVEVVVVPELVVRPLWPAVVPCV